MSKPTCKAEKHPWSVIRREVRHLNAREMQATDNDVKYAKRQANRARRRDGRISMCQGWDQWEDMVFLRLEMLGWWAWIEEGEL